MNISYHPMLKREARELKKFVKENEINLDINIILGGDGSLFTYLSTDKPNFLISSPKSVGYYAGARLNNYKRVLLKYAENPEVMHKKMTSISVKINDKTLPEQALNDVLITEGLHRLLRVKVNGSVEKNSGLLFYTHHGWHGYAVNLDAKHYNEGELGLIAIAPTKGGLYKKKGVKAGTTTIRVLKRKREQKLKLYIDCKDVKPYDPSCSDRKKIYHKPYQLKPGDEVTISKGKPITIIK